ncbi:DNA-binding protein [Bacillus cereus]|uniref:helix-turn-helix domain-containing protein n=1 Tax=Bacillus TaxID=1386 RepID=UPI000BF6158D|nr:MULTISPECIES: helix-turn-helix domain-containing protein [Bacillus cereus group]PFN42052.1 DNA-binding protein [Bacillus cereus]MCU5206234.1 helix-turn-helix domain-containing protein [Bacillus paranthracis]MDA2164276.1 helix-turn-helix domain-containing protein [Bacillus cereus group sp. Bc252]MDF9513524.1 helix-turn-helix domain-containing protein [Bacillus paranthracis]MDF9672480.1 helix-turn-helix domain-containing protein [Bacillus paranthracis]
MSDFKQQKIFTNNTDFYMLVGNYTSILSYHKTLETATLALKSISGSDNTWPSVWIMAPGEIFLEPYINTIPEENSNTSYDSFTSLKNIIGVEETAKFLGRSSQTIRNMCVAGKLPAKKIEGKWILDKTMLKF